MVFDFIFEKDGVHSLRKFIILFTFSLVVKMPQKRTEFHVKVKIFGAENDRKVPKILLSFSFLSSFNLTEPNLIVL